MSVSIEYIASTWHQFLIDVMFAKNYTIAYIDNVSTVPKNPILEQILPSLLYIKGVSILDHALQAWTNSKGINIPKRQYGRDLYGRLKFFADNNYLGNQERLHAIRDTRNDIAHELNRSVTWPELDSVVSAINDTLCLLDIAHEVQEWEVSSERSAAGKGEIPNADCTFHHRVMIRHSTQIIAELKWSTHIMKDCT